MTRTTKVPAYVDNIVLVGESAEELKEIISSIGASNIGLMVNKTNTEYLGVSRSKDSSQYFREDKNLNFRNVSWFSINDMIDIIIVINGRVFSVAYLKLKL